MTQSDLKQALIESAGPVPLHIVEDIIEKTHLARDRFALGAIIAAVLETLFLLLCCNFGALFVGKVIVIQVMVSLGVVCLAVFLFRHDILGHLTDAEEVAYIVRDQAFVDLNMAREEMRRLRHKLRRDTDDEGYGHVNELLKMVSPLMMMFIQKEKNVLRWGMFGWKVAQNAMAVIKQRSKES